VRYATRREACGVRDPARSVLGLRTEAAAPGLYGSSYLRAALVRRRSAGDDGAPAIRAWAEASGFSSHLRHSDARRVVSGGCGRGA
jgi:hypothetical protein